MAPPTTQATTLDRQQWIQKYGRHPNGIGEGDTFTMANGSKWQCVRFRGRDRLYQQQDLRLPIYIWCKIGAGTEALPLLVVCVRKS